MNMNKVLKFLTIITTAICLSLLIACKGKHSSENKTSQVTIESLKGHRSLVIYFSRAGENYIVGNVQKGNTAFVAEYIAELTDADIFEIKAEKNYESLSYEEMLNVVRKEYENSEMPGFKTDLTDVGQYDVVFIGGPIWWGTYPRLMLSFFKEFDLNGKVLIPFTTNEGSGLGNTKVDLQKAFPKAKVLNGFSITGYEARKPEAREVVKEWLDTLSLSRCEEHVKTDGITGATKLNKDYTECGRNLDNIVTSKVRVKYKDGREDDVEMVVQGSVDMGDGLVWSATNLGASKPWEPGNHYAWGETEPKKSYTEDNYTYLNKQIGDDISHTWYDAASIALGGDWHIPTYEEWYTFLQNADLEFVMINDVKGHLFKAKNGNVLFIPGNGYVYKENVSTPNEGYYWSSTYSTLINAYVTYLPENSWGQSNYGRHIGIGIRAVRRLTFA